MKRVITSICIIVVLINLACQKRYKEYTELADCPYPSFTPPLRYESGCLNACQYVYQGEVNFHQKTISINCENHQLPKFCKMEWYIDPQGYPVYADNTYLPAIFIKLHNIESTARQWFCSQSEWFQFQYLGTCSFSIRYRASFSENDGSTIALRIVPEPEFWDCYNHTKYPADFWFQIISTTPINLQCPSF